MSMYAYDFQTCGFAIIDDVRAIIESQPEWDFSNSIKAAEANCVVAAKRFGYTRLTSDEHHALVDFLVAKKAGLHIATYAWGTYADLKAKQSTEFANKAELATA
ncbi:MAG: hypothetical protein HKO02_03080 [Hyphomonadaceae bacterium]|nr:hypothetical protein [Hyphomonadaceae bacterium]